MYSTVNWEAFSEVAERVGYAKQSQFAAAFRKRFGVSPKDY
ncbi:MAG: helix-turn-helix domain-containing protein [Lachnospiraceae bacterium]|nr:helix-turn-helix domain-containing protein [Lachnospiraceae bacterium]